MSEYIIKLPNGGAADEFIGLHGYEKSLYGYELHEEIVRCRDCKLNNGFCHKWWKHVNDDGFCSWGERRENGN